MEKIIILGEESPDAPCEYCGEMSELRPYGKNGAKICFTCGMKPENIATTEAAFSAVLGNVSPPIEGKQSN